MATFLSLPPELMTRIASHLSTEEFGRLRASNKQIENYLFHTFAKEFFTKRQFMIEHESLQALLDISNHPRLGENLQEVIISTYHFRQDRMGYGTSVIKFYEERLKHGYLDRATLLATGQAHSMLAEAFSNLPNLRVIGIRDFDREGRWREGPTAQWRAWGWSKLPDAYDAHLQTKEYFPFILSVLAVAGVQPERIEVFLRRHSQLNRQSFIFSNGLNLDSILEKIKTIMLSIKLETFPNLAIQSPHVGESTEAMVVQQPLRAFLHHVKHIEHLRLNLGHGVEAAILFLMWLAQDPAEWPSGSRIPMEVRPVVFSDLKVLELGAATLSSQVLYRTLTHLRLREISIWKITLLRENPNDRSENCWANLLRQLATKLSSDVTQSMFIGNVSQRSLGHSYHSLDEIHWVAEDLRNKWPSTIPQRIIKYTAQHITGGLTDWLEKSAKSAIVPEKHEAIYPYALQISSEEEGEDEDDEDVFDSEDDFVEDDEYDSEVDMDDA